MSRNNEVPINEASPGRGKVNKQALIRQVIEQESSNGQPPDMKRVLLIAKKRMEQAPEEVRKDVQLTRRDYQAVVVALNRQRQQGSPTTTQPPTNNESQPTPPEFFTAQSILAAKEFLNHHCGGSLVKAQALLQLIIALSSK